MSSELTIELTVCEQIGRELCRLRIILDMYTQKEKRKMYEFVLKNTKKRF
jgi:hypothetical protein